jgi:hypothetical protein
MQKVLIDRSQFAGQLFVEKAQNIGITLHDRSLILPWHGLESRRSLVRSGWNATGMPNTNLVQRAAAVMLIRAAWGCQFS